MKITANSRNQMRNNAANSRRDVLRYIGTGLTTSAMSLFLGAKTAHSAIPRIGFLSVPPSGDSPVFDAFQKGMHDLGYKPGSNISIEWLCAEGKETELPKLATDLVNARVDVIVAETYPAILAAKKATSTIPIVMAISSDPIETGLVASLARPGGNITGLTTVSTDLNGKRLQLLKEAAPGISRLALVWASLAAPDKAPGIREVRRVAEAMGLQIEYIEIHKNTDWEPALQALLQMRPAPDSVFELCDPVTLSRRKALVTFAAKSHLPSIFEMKEYVTEGGLMAYGPSLASMGYRSAYFVDRIIKGKKPEELPVEQPTKFELVINLQTAKDIGLRLPESILSRADETIG